MSNAINRFFLKQELKKRNSKKQFTEWNEVKNVGVVAFNDANVISNVKNFTTESGKAVDLIVFSNDKVSDNKNAALSLNLKDFKWTGLLSEEALAKLRSKNYDVVISCDKDSNKNLKAINLLANAKCVVGMAQVDYKNNFDIIIDGDTTDIGNFLKQALKYLRMIKAT